LGIPVSPLDFEEASNGSYWLRQAVTTSNGYEISPERENVGGALCVKITKGLDDSLWFSVDEPVRLLKRDVWRTSISSSRQVAEFSEYKTNGLPERVVHTHYTPVDKIGDPSAIRGIETITLDRLEFIDTPKEEFVVTIEEGVGVADVNTHSSFQTEQPGTPPFDKLLRLMHEGSQNTRQSRLSWLFDINLLIASGMLLAFMIRRSMIARRNA
jgi:hypothetical protein